MNLHSDLIKILVSGVLKGITDGRRTDVDGENLLESTLYSDKLSKQNVVIYVSNAQSRTV